MALHFTWDQRKDRGNQMKHGVSFDEAKTVFSDEYARIMEDSDHSPGEERFVLLGLSGRLRVLLVSHTYRRDDEEIRIVSARKASRSEHKQYWQFRL